MRVRSDSEVGLRPIDALLDGYVRGEYSESTFEAALDRLDADALVPSDRLAHRAPTPRRWGAFLGGVECSWDAAADLTIYVVMGTTTVLVAPRSLRTTGSLFVRGALASVTVVLPPWLRVVPSFRSFVGEVRDRRRRAWSPDTAREIRIFGTIVCGNLEIVDA